MTHWAEQYIGKPWRLGTSGPDTFDCWGLVRAVLGEHFGIAVPVIEIPDCAGLAVVREATKQLAQHPELARWQAVAVPRAGDGVKMSCARDPWHVGLWLDVDGGGVLHCLEGPGVIFSSPAALKAAGWGRVTYWRFTG